MIGRPLSNVAGSLVGMPHGGCGAKLRRSLTDFGSPWRGLLKLPTAVTKLDVGFGEHFMAASFSPSGLLKRMKGVKSTEAWKNLTVGEQRSVTQFKLQTIQAHEYGWTRAVAIDTSKFSDSRLLKSAIVHERVHQFRSMQGWWGKSVDTVHELWETNFASRYRYLKGIKDPSRRAIASSEEYMAFGVQTDYLTSHGVAYTGNQTLDVALDLFDIMDQPFKGQAKGYMHRTRTMVAAMTQAARERGLKMVKMNTSNFTTPGVARQVANGGRNKMPTGGN